MLRWECIHNTSQNHVKETRRSADPCYDGSALIQNTSQNHVKETRRSADPCYDGSALIHNSSQNHVKETRRSADPCYDGSAFTTRVKITSRRLGVQQIRVTMGVHSQHESKSRQGD